MRTVLNLLLAIFFGLAGNIAHAAHTQVRLLLSADTVKPGDTILVGVDLKMEPDWHTYWKNPGEAGMATEIKWQLPPGITNGEIQWPLPEKFPPAEVTTYGYSNEVMLVVPLTVGTNMPPGPVDLQANVSWLECKEVCIPGGTNVQASLMIGAETKVSTNAALIESWRQKQPFTMSGSATDHAWWENPATNDTRTLVIGHFTSRTVKFDFIKYDAADFFPDANEHYEIQGPTEITSAYASDIRLRKVVKKYDGDWPTQISGVLVLQHGNWRGGNAASLKVENEVPPDVAAFEKPSPPKPPAPPLPLPSPMLMQMLLYAFIGGLILNIMPCVLPVIALKILGFVGEARSDPRRVRFLGIVYAAGVLVSFLALAEIVIAVKAAGRQAGWGMQFGNPVFIVCLITLVTLVALNLFGVFEVTPSGRAFDAAGDLASRHGAAGAFFNGVLATTLATPCTAPFLSIALGFAFAQSSLKIILIFLFVGLGLAAPYVLLSCNPALLKFLPRPGVWMEKFKIAMGFPMLATVVWLFSIAASSYGKNVLWLGIFLVIVAFAAWIFGQFVQAGRNRKTVVVAAIVTIGLLTGGYDIALEKELDWRTAMPETNLTGSLKESPDGIEWQRWNPAAVKQARDEGHPVLVDFTADWCLTCQVNKKTSIEIPSVRAKLKDLNAVAFIGDYTHFNTNITTALNLYKRAGVPLVLVYSKTTNAPPMVLPEVLTPGIVLDALDRAAH